MNNEPHAFPIRDDEHLALVIAKAYDLSSPQGMGYLHHVAGPIPADTLQELISGNKGRSIDLDYVHGRSVKLGIHVDRLVEPVPNQTIYFVENRDIWFDHTAEQWLELKRVLSGDHT